MGAGGETEREGWEEEVRTTSISDTGTKAGERGGSRGVEGGQAERVEREKPGGKGRSRRDRIAREGEGEGEEMGRVEDGRGGSEEWRGE